MIVVMAFHWSNRNKGKNIELSAGGRIATRMRRADYGGVISEECLQLGQKIRFRLDQVTEVYGFGLVRGLLILFNSSVCLNLVLKASS